MKLGSLFDGSGGFPLAGAMCGCEPVWAAEVEPYPIAVTTSRFPTMKHLGDVSKVNGAEIEPVDIITFGSPCQDMSVAGKRAGIKHDEHGDEETTRSGLFYEAVRIIKEMRDGTEGRCPTFVIWENVPGAFSSNGGQDFRTVLEELVKIVEPQAVMPDVPKGGWAYADCYRGDGWSLAYRVFDAQHIRTAQRRKRIYLVLDLGGQRALQILAQRDRLRRNTPQGGEARKATPSDAQRGVGADDREGEAPYTLKIRSGCDGGGKGALVPLDKSATLATNNDQYLFHPVAYGISAYESNAMKSPNPHSGVYKADTSRTLDLNGGNPACNQGGVAVLEAVGFDGYNASLTGDRSMSITGAACDIHHIPGVVCSECASLYDAYQHHGWRESNVCGTLTSGQNNTVRGDTPLVMEPFCKSARATNPDDATTWKHGVVANTLNTFDHGEARANELVVEGSSDRFFAACQEAVGTLMANAGTKLWLGNQEAFSGDYSIVEGTPPHYIVRRLTPTECARLQGFPDRWGDINTKDSMTDEDFRFWLEVRQTYDRINGRAAKDYTPTQVLTWYNKLHTDSAEYKMWGNGIALPCALYVMEGIEEAYHEV